LFLESFVSHT